MAISGHALEFLINHVVLPPKLPQTSLEPGGDGEGIAALISLVRKSWDKFEADLVSHNLRKSSIRNVRNMLKGFEKSFTKNNGANTLKQLLEEMTVSGGESQLIKGLASHH